MFIFLLLKINIMKTIKNLTLSFIVTVLFLGVTNVMAINENSKVPKKAILLVHFGTTIESAQKTLKNIDQVFRKEFPKTEIRWAFSAKFIRKKLRKLGIHYDSPEQALAKLGEDGYKNIAVQSLHTIPGSEYTNLKYTVRAFNNMPKGTQNVVLGNPLLYSHTDMLKVSKALLANVSNKRKFKEAVLFMGHGSHHYANIFYPALQYYISKQDKNTYIGTVEGAPLLEDIIPELKERKIKTIWLMPLMSVVGDHALNDLAGDEEDSWKSRLKKLGFNVKIYNKATADMPQILDIWVSHLRTIWNNL